MTELSIDEVAAVLLRAGLIPPRAVVDGSLSIVDVSRRNRNYRATWSDGDGVLLKQPDALDPSCALTLQNEAGFYSACLRTAPDFAALSIPTPLPEIAKPPALVLRLVRDALPLWEFRKENPDSTNVYAALGRALALFHRFGASDAFRKDSFVKELSAAPSWVLSVHKPPLAALHHMSKGQLGFYKIVQRETEIGAHLERLAAKLQTSTVIHGDIKADNVLVSGRAAEDAHVTLVDWELAQHGDPAWDVGAVFQDLLASWLQELNPTADKTMQVVLDEASGSLKAIHPMFRAFWSAYATTSELEPEVRDQLHARSVDCSAACFVRRAYELAQEAEHVPNHTITMLQVAANLFASPPQGSLSLYGLPLSTRRRFGSRSATP